MTRVLAAGDHFVLPRLLRDALEAEMRCRTASRPARSGVELTELMLPWPKTPFGPVAEVLEASGTEDEMIAALSGVHACMTHLGPLTERILAACPDLELFVVSRGGPVNANLVAATAAGVAVCYAPGRNAAATAEHTVALILAALRDIPSLHAALVAGKWLGDRYAYDQVGSELDGSTVGLVGYGAVGTRVAKVLVAFGGEVLVHDPYADTSAMPAGVSAAGLDTLLRRSAVVSVHARVSSETTGMIGAPEIALMPPGAVLVNCARGALVDYDAVCDALDAQHLAAAAFDVYPEEPVPPDSRLLRTRNVVVTPHLAGASRQVAEKAARIAAAEVGRWLRGEPLVHVANPDVLAR